MTQPSLIDRVTIVELVITSLSEVIAQGDQPIPAELNEDTVLIGRSAVLDSLGMVTLIVEIERQIEEQFGWILALANDRAMSQKNSPFRTVQTLSDYVVSLIAEEGANG